MQDLHNCCSLQPSLAFCFSLQLASMLCLLCMYIDCPVIQYGPVLHLLTILCISAIVHMVAFVNLLLKKIMITMMMMMMPMTASGRYAVIGCKLKQNANEGCNNCASLAGLVLSIIARFILLVIAPLKPVCQYTTSHHCDALLAYPRDMCSRLRGTV